MIKKTSMLLAAAAIGALLVDAGAARAQDIPVAVAGPLTGQLAALGDQFKRGAEMAVEDLNAAGGVAGKKLKLELGDDQCDPKQAVAVANQLSVKKVALVAGHACSGSSIPASAVYNENNVIMITPASTAPALTDEAAKKGWHNVFRALGRDDAQGAVAGRAIAQRFKDKKVAILHDKSAYGKGLADETKKAMNAAGLKETMYESVTAGDKDFSALVSKMKAGNIDVVYFGGYHTEAGLMLRQAREQGFQAQFIGGDGLNTDEFGKIVGATGEGFRMTFTPDPRKNPNAAKVVERFKAKGLDPEGYTLYTYATFQVWSEAVKKAGTLDSTKVQNALRQGEFDTVLGKLSFDAKGDVKNPDFVFYVFKDGKWVEDPTWSTKG